MAKSYQWVERSVYSMLNAFTTDGGPASAEALITGTAVLVPADIYDATYPPADVRKAILDQEFWLITRLCRTPGHPSRGKFKQNVALAHGAVLPQVLSTDHLFEVDVAGTAIVSTPRRHASEVNAIRNDPSYVPVKPYHAIEGNVFYCTYDEADFIYYGLASGDTNSPHAATINQMFDSSTDLIKIPDEFVLPLLFFSLAQLVSTVDSNSSMAAPYLAAGSAALAALGINVDN